MLQRAIFPVDENPEPRHDLWLAMRQRLNNEPQITARPHSVPWFDWALAGGLAVFVIAFPAAVPMLLYYL